MTRYFNTHDEAYAWVDCMMDKYDHYYVKSVNGLIEVTVY